MGGKATNHATEEEDPVTRMESVRAATGTARRRLRHAAEVVEPAAHTARRSAARYARQAKARWGPQVSSAARRARTAARDSYGTHLEPQLARLRSALPPEVDRAATRVTRSTRDVARKAAQYAGPRLEAAREAAGPVREEAAARSLAALAALRGEVTPREVARLRARRRRRARVAGVAKGVAALGALAGAAWLAWWWWERQSNPDWLTEPSAATEVPDGASALPPSGAEAPRSAPRGAEPPAAASSSGGAESDETR